MNDLLQTISKCQICADSLEHGPRPVLSAHPDCRLAIVGQAPGSVVHRTGVPWDDKSGENLRRWLVMDNETFYDESKVALVPMGFCYPGKGKSGDLPPRKECAPEWHESVFAGMKNLELILLVGKYAQDYYLTHPGKNLTETVRRCDDYLPKYFPLPHPSPRNNIWQAKNPWFGEEVLPQLQQRVREALPESYS